MILKFLYTIGKINNMDYSIFDFVIIIIPYAFFTRKIR